MRAIVFYKASFITIPPEDREGGNDDSGPVRYVNPDTITPEEKIALLREIKAGDISEIRYRSEAFGDIPNLNGVRLKPGRLSELLSDFPRPLVTDHSFSVKDHVGSVTGGEVFERDGSDRLALDRSITHPDEQAAFVRGERRDNSVALDADRWFCSECGLTAYLGYFGPYRFCECLQGEVFGEGNERLIHDAHVSIPAYTGETLSAFNEANLSGGAFFGVQPFNQKTTPPEETTMPANKDDATTPDAAEFEKMKREHAEFAAERDRLKGELEESDKARLSEALDRAVSEMKVSRSEAGVFEVLRKAEGLQYALDAIKARPVNPRFSAEAVGFGASETPAPPIDEETAPSDDPHLLSKICAGQSATYAAAFKKLHPDA